MVVFYGIRAPAQGANDFFTPHIPSGFHDRARSRSLASPEHDDMQRAVLSFLRSRQRPFAAPGAEVLHEVEGEKPLFRRGQIVGYADCFEMVQVNLFRTISLYEIKPKIESMFGVLRQAKALLALARTNFKASDHYVHVIAKHGDPALEGLRSEWPHTWAWGWAPSGLTTKRSDEHGSGF